MALWLKISHNRLVFSQFFCEILNATIISKNERTNWKSHPCLGIACFETTCITYGTPFYAGLCYFLCLRRTHHHKSRILAIQTICIRCKCQQGYYLMWIMVTDQNGNGAASSRTWSELWLVLSTVSGAPTMICDYTNFALLVLFARNGKVSSFNLGYYTNGNSILVFAVRFKNSWNRDRGTLF